MNDSKSGAAAFPKCQELQQGCIAVSNVCPEKVRELVSQCLQARDRAYCPYSHFPVGAAVLTEDGAIITGCNVENASYGLTVCAERTAIQRAVAEGHRKFKAIAVTCDIKDRFVGPCGACRQVLMEFGSNWTVYLTKPGGSFRETSLTDLLPLAFSPEHLIKHDKC
ncbi:zgc:103586 [Synchiropus splendidus]|uniref:zgc:103586 n=1 Tax=Synchiropus splendidus TaxID=270530 RepID=UPI00237E1179|nr:zgc:103586 [Synchiropus splendidus]